MNNFLFGFKVFLIILSIFPLFVSVTSFLFVFLDEETKSIIHLRTALRNLVIFAIMVGIVCGLSVD